MSDFNAMTDDELNAWIAKRLGWRVEFEKPTPKHRYKKWLVYRPDGSLVSITYPKSARPNLDRILAYWGGNKTASVDDALTLPFMPYMVKLDQTTTTVWECALRWGGEDLERYFAYAQKPARAICIAWAEMTEAETEEP